MGDLILGLGFGLGLAFLSGVLVTHVGVAVTIIVAIVAIIIYTAIVT